MFFVANFLKAIAEVLDIIFNIYMFMIIIRALISWVNPDPFNPIVRFLHQVTEPVLSPLRRIIPTYRIGIDVSPLIAILLIIFIKTFIVGSIYDFSAALKRI
ncbi:MAG: YggT family protein [Candidatus Aenigmatarchaeota archaeon]